MRSKRLLTLRTRYAIFAAVAFVAAVVIGTAARGVVETDPGTLLAIAALSWLATFLGVAFTLGAIAARITAEGLNRASEAPQPGQNWYD